MHAKFFALAALVASVVALPQRIENETETNTKTCSTGTQHCCESVQDASHDDVKQAAQKAKSGGLLGGLLDLDNLLGGGIKNQVGLTCTVGTSCTQQVVCCDGNNFSGLLVLGCTPINVDVL